MDHFLEWMSHEVPQKEVLNRHILNPEPVISPGSKIMLKNNYIVISDNTQHSFSLLSESGELLDRTGRYGRGPGEFEAINEIQIGPDGLLYVLDLLLMRMTSFKVDEHFEYVNSYSSNHSNEFHLKSIINSESGLFGIFNRVTSPFNDNSQFQLYSMNDDLTMNEYLFEIPGNEKIELQSGIFTDHLAGLTTFWGVKDDQLYYVSSHDFTIHEFNLGTGDQGSISFLEHVPEDRPMTPTHLSILEERFEPILRRDPSYAKALQNIDRLPFIRQLTIHENYFLFTILKLDSTSGVVLVYDSESEEVWYISTPRYFTPFAIHDSRLIGIDYTSPHSNPLLALEF